MRRERHAELTAEGIGDALLALFDKMVRGLEKARISSFVVDIIAEARTKGDPELLKNRFVLAFHGARASARSFIICSWCTMSAMRRCWWTSWSSFQLTDRGDTCSTFSSSAIMATWAIALAVTRCVEHVCTPVEGRPGGARCSNVPRAYPKRSLAAKHAPLQGGQPSRVLKVDA